MGKIKIKSHVYWYGAVYEVVSKEGNTYILKGISSHIKGEITKVYKDDPYLKLLFRAGKGVTYAKDKG